MGSQPSVGTFVATELRAGLLTVVSVRGWDVRAAVSALRVREALLSPSAEQFQALVRKRLAEISRRDDKRLMSLTRSKEPTPAKRSRLGRILIRRLDGKLDFISISSVTAVSAVLSRTWTERGGKSFPVRAVGFHW